MPRDQQLIPQGAFNARRRRGAVDAIRFPLAQAAKDENLGMPSMTAELSTRAVLRVAASVVDDAKQGGGDISDAVKSRLLV